MARVGNKLTKLKWAMKRLPSLTNKLGRTGSNLGGGGGGGGGGGEKVSAAVVYVGKSRRRYDVGGDVAEHPLFRELVDSSGREEDDGGVHVADCEVVMFDHLLWMIHNSVDDSSTDHNNLVHFYTAC